MRLLHVSDIHFGIETYSRTDPETGMPTRLLDFMRAFDRAIKAAFNEGVDAVLFTGDAYKSRDPNPTVQREFAKRIHQLAAGGIPVYLLTGNHDVPNTSTRAHAIEIFQTLSVPNVYVSRGIDLTVMQTRSGPLQVLSLPWVTRAGLIAKEEYKGKSLSELDELMTTRITDSLNARFRLLEPEIPAVMAVHATIDGATYSSERSIMLGQDLIVQKSMLGGEYFDYIAIGHIHKHQAIRVGDTPAVYPGSIERIDFGEEKEEKGFVIVEIDEHSGSRATRKTEWQFVPDYMNRPFRTLELDIQGIETDGIVNPTTAALQTLQREVARWETGLREAIVRLRIKMRPDQEAAMREDEIRRALFDLKVYHIASINKEVDRFRRTRLAGVSVEELTPLQLLEKYLQTKNIDPQRMEILLKHAHAIINRVGYQ
jgi:exonuclease SbcD